MENSGPGPKPLCNILVARRGYNLSVKMPILASAAAAACLLQAAPASASKLVSPSFIDASGVYGLGSAALLSANFEGEANAQEVSVSTLEAASFSSRSGKLSFFPAPSPVPDLALVIVSSASLRASWSAPYADARRREGAAGGYLLRYTTAAPVGGDEEFLAAATYAQAWSPLAPLGAEIKLLDGFNAGVTYYFSLESVNEHGLRSEISNAAAALALPPLPPMNFSLARATGSVTLAWTPPGGFQSRIPFHDRLSPAAPYEVRGYAVYRATAPAASSWEYLGETSSTTLSWTDPIGPSDLYYYHARALNQAGESLPSYSRGTAGASLYFLAPDNQSLLEVPQAAAGALFAASADPMDAYSIVTTTHAEDLGGRVMKSVEFSAYRGGMELDPSFKLGENGTLKLYYAKAGGSIVPSAGDEKSLSLFYHNGSRWLQLYGSVDPAERSVRAQTSLLGRYQLRTTERSGSFAADRAGLLNRLITPNGDGKNDTMTFIFDNPQAKGVSGRIYDLRGALVGTMKPGPVENSLVWDAKAGGRPVPGGAYVYQLEADGTVYNGTVVVVR